MAVKAISICIQFCAVPLKGSIKLSTSVATHPSELAQAAFRTEFGSSPTFLTRAPGRVNVIGEHVDYNDGFVLPAALNLEACLAFTPRHDQKVRIHAVAYEETGEFALSELSSRGKGNWIDYIAGPAWVLQKLGHTLQGFDAALASNVPVASGLSSSAAVEVAAMRTYQSLAGLAMSRVETAKAAQRAENEYVGVNCGIMDQFICTLGRSQHLLLIDCRSLAYEQVPVPTTISLVIADTTASRSLAGSAYNERVAECGEGLAGLKQKWPEISSWRDVHWDQVSGPLTPLTGLPQMRARHVVSEIDRTLKAATLFKNGDVAAVGRLMHASHASLRDDYQVSSTALDSMVEIAASYPDCLGARLTGAGFGGCTVALVKAGSEAGFMHLIQEQFPRKTSLQPQVYTCKTSNGAEVLSL